MAGINIFTNPRLWTRLLLAAVIAALALQNLWLPAVKSQLAAWGIIPGSDDPEAGHDHAHADHAAGTSIEISRQAKKNIGLKEGPLELRLEFEQTVSIPGIVVEQRGRSVVEISAPVTGIVTRVAPIQGQAVSPDEVLFKIRMTHEELIQAQSDLLKAAEELEVIGREVTRLEKVTAGGAVAGKTLLDRKYDQQKQEAAIRSQKQALLLHGLSDIQIDEILTTRQLVQGFTVSVPGAKRAKNTEPSDSAERDAGAPREPVVYQVQKLSVDIGQHVAAGDRLCVLANHQSLLIEGRAFDHDAELLNEAVKQDWPVAAVLKSATTQQTLIKGLKIRHLANKVDPESRAFHFYVELPNRVLRDAKDAEGRRFLNWEFKPGQRMQLRVPVKVWTEQLVAPVEAVVQEGAETFIFVPDGDVFVRTPVTVLYRDDREVVIKADGSIFKGDTIALNAAHQLNLALKNKLSGPVDPHAGHNH